MEGFAKAEVVDIDDETLGNLGVDSFNLEFFQGHSELTTGFNTFSVTFKFYGNRHNNGFVVGYFEQVEVKDIVFNRMELNLTENSHLFAAVIFKFDSEDVGSIDEFANSFVGYCKVSGDDTAAVFDFNDFFSGLQGAFEGEFKRFAAIEDNGDFTGCAEVFSCFFAKIHTGFGGQFVSLHCLLIKKLCYSKLIELISHHTGCLKATAKLRFFCEQCKSRQP